MIKLRSIPEGPAIRFRSVQPGIKLRAVSSLKGDKGDAGLTPVISIGSVDTLASGEDATASITGTIANPLLNLGIPQGEQGEQGIQGIQGVQGVQGEKGDKGDTGATGATGAKGDKGDAATISVGTVTTVGPSDPATVTNVGTSGAAVFDFEIPKGDAGDGSGNVVGPSSATDGHLAVFDGATGKLIKDGGATSAFATAAQGTKADTALQSADIGDTVQAYDAQLFSNIPNASGDNNSSFTATRAAHASKHVGFYDSNDYTVTISTGQGFVAGDVVTLYNTGGATITVAQDSGVTLISKDGTGSHTFGGPMMTIFFVSTVGAILSGDNLAAV